MARRDPKIVSYTMSRILSKDTSPELRVRRIVHRLGFRYRIHRKDLPGKPDLAFIGKKKVIFVHGCFWHQHKSPNCKNSRIPKSNTEYWIPKLQLNAKRDRKHLKLLKEMDWKALVVWECETKKPEKIIDRITDFLK